MTTMEPAYLQMTTAGLAESAIMAARSNPLEAARRPEVVDSNAPAAPASFSHLIGRIMEFARQTPEKHDVEVRKHVEELVATTLVAPILKNLNEDPLESGLFKKTHGEKALRPLLEAEIAKKIVHHMRSGLVDQVARRLLSANRTAEPMPGRRLDVTERSSTHA